MLIRSVEPRDFSAWKPLCDGYNAFYGREGATALACSPAAHHAARVWGERCTVANHHGFIVYARDL